MAGEANGARASPGGHATLTHDGSSPGSESDSEVNSSIDRLDTEVRELYAALDNQKRLLKEVARERRKLRVELACAREKSGKDECASCISHMNDLVSLRAKHNGNVANLDVAKISREISQVQA
jgi:regulator of replication initiation timing